MTMKRLKIAILAYANIASDMRVRRTAEALAAAGHAVTTIGYGSNQTDAYAHFEIPQPSPRQNRAAFLLTNFPANVFPFLAPHLHFLRMTQRRARDVLLELNPDVIHANDWIALPAAVAAKHATGAKLIYDSHEFAAEEHADNRVWRIVVQRSAQETERRLIREADRIITVGEGLSRALRDRYSLADLPTPILNAPPFVDVRPSPDTSPRTILYHGVVKRARGIEQGILAMRELPDYRFVIRGNGADRYLDELKMLVLRSGVKDRVHFERAVAPDEVVRAAASAQIGLFCAPLTTVHNRIAMPNKFFEYAMANLALVVTKGSDLGLLVEKQGCGIACDCSPDSIASQIKAITTAELEGYRLASGNFSRAHSWEGQKDALLNLYQEIM